jgi:CTP synthase
MVKYIVVAGGVISGIGKGVIASSTGLLMKSKGFHVTAIKIDPYLNIDAGTMSPLDHGEVFVLDDGGEVDLDLGNYERFLDITLNRDNNITTGKIYKNVIDRERKGDYLGKTVQVVPHITDAIQDWVERVGKIPVDGTCAEPDICIVELGGTVGDIESAPFVEALRQFQFRVGHENFCLIMVCLVPVVGSVGEQKTKPTQNAIRDLRSLGLSPDIIVCRSQSPLDTAVRSKISMFCHVSPEQVLTIHDCKSVYHVPFLLESQEMFHALNRRLKFSIPANNFASDLWANWRTMVDSLDFARHCVKIVLVGKYTHLQDSYISVVKALQHASFSACRKLSLEWVEASDLEMEMKNMDPIKYHNAWKMICDANGILIPGGFGERGIEGKILAAQYARERNIPYLGICLGMQIAVIEFARNILGLKNAHSEEFDKSTTDNLIVFMPEISKTHMGGTMRLGVRNTVFSQDCVTKKLYGSDIISERHRHRYEVNIDYRSKLASKGLKFVGTDENKERMEVMELDDHPYFVGVQYHPEYKSRPLSPSPVFLGFILAASDQLNNYLGGNYEKRNHELLKSPEFVSKKV